MVDSICPPLFQTFNHYIQVRLSNGWQASYWLTIAEGSSFSLSLFRHGRTRHSHVYITIDCQLVAPERRDPRLKTLVMAIKHTKKSPIGRQSFTRKLEHAIVTWHHTLFSIESGSHIQWLWWRGGWEGGGGGRHCLYIMDSIVCAHQTRKGEKGKKSERNYKLEFEVISDRIYMYVMMKWDKYLNLVSTN